MAIDLAFSRRLLLPLLALPLVVAAQGYKTQNVILITADGLRWEDVFRGADPVFLNGQELGMKSAWPSVKQQYGGATAAERRQKLMPFLWSYVATKGAIFGNRDAGSEVNIRNRHRFSYPGYSEMLTGRPQDEAVKSNDNKPNPSKTSLEIAREELKLPAERVALIGGWDSFQGIGAHTPGNIFINAGYQRINLPNASARMKAVDALQDEILSPWNSVRHDYITYELAIEYLRTIKPRVMHLALGETDDWAHGNRYDRYLHAANYLDKTIQRVWEFVESDPFYKGKTTILVTVDHGRGPDVATFPKHGEKVEGAQHIWIAALGPDMTPVGEAKSGVLTQSDIGPTILDLLGIDYRKLAEVQGKPIPQVMGKTR